MALGLRFPLRSTCGSNLFSADTDLNSDVGTDTDTATGADTEMGTGTDTEFAVVAEGGGDLCADTYIYTDTTNQISRDLYWRQYTPIA